MSPTETRFHLLMTLTGVSIFSLSSRILSQEKSFEVRSANVLNVRTVGNQQIQALIGNVHLVQPSSSGEVRIWCDSAFRNLQTNVANLWGNVKIVRDSTVLTSTEGTYFANERWAHMPSPVRLNRGRMILTAQSGEYWANEKRATFHGNVRVVDSTSTTLSDGLTFFENEEKSIATGNVRVLSSENNLTIFGDSLIHFDKGRYTVVPKNPRLMQVDTSSTGTVDTLLVAATIMETGRDSIQRFISRGKVEMARSDLAARCGEAVYFVKGDEIILRENPVVWHTENQVTGDSIVIRTSERKLKTVYVHGRSMAISRVDSAYRARYNQLSAREITMHFRNSKIDQIDADRNATSLYYLFDGKEPNGVNRSSGDRILMEFLDGKIDRLKIVGGVEGRYFPERMIAHKESVYNLDGFRLIPDRPKRQNLSLVHESNDW